MRCLIVFGFLFLLCNGQEEVREPRFFFGEKPHTVTNYRQISQIVTEFIPSSCIFIEPSLPPCRHVRSFQIFPSTPTRITKTQSPNIHNLPSQEVHRYRSPGSIRPSETVHGVPTPPLNWRPTPIKTHSHYWAWSLFNPFNRFQNVTHTVVKTEYVTTKVEDPHTVVSFHVKGCRPSRLPFNLSECDKPEPVQEQKKNIIVMAPLKFIAPMDKLPTPTYKGAEHWEDKDNDDESNSTDYKPVDGDEAEPEPESNTRTDVTDQTKFGEYDESQTETSNQEISGDGL